MNTFFSVIDLLVALVLLLPAFLGIQQLAGEVRNKDPEWVQTFFVLALLVYVLSRLVVSPLAALVRLFA